MSANGQWERRVRAFVYEWFRRLDEHAPVEQVESMLSAQSLEMVLPETTLHDRAAFRKWYEDVTRLFFDEKHELKRLDVAIAPDGGAAEVSVVARWEARRWRAPAARSEWIGFDAAQRWSVALSADGRRLEITRYIVDALEPLPGSPPL
jgi:hypothetical protein